MDVEDRIDKIIKETNALRREMVAIKALIKEQNVLINDLMVRRQQAAHSTTATGFFILNPHLRFPIESQAALDEMENTIHDENSEAFIAEVRRRLGLDGTLKHLTKVLSQNIIMDYNIDGLQKKNRLLDYPRLLDVLHKASNPDKNRESFLEILRKSIRNIKNRNSREAYERRRSEKQKTMTDDNDTSDVTQMETDQRDTEHGDYFKYEDLGLPISSQEALQGFENSINKGNRSERILEMREALGTLTLRESITNILTEDMIFDYNLEGKQHKKRLLDYPQFVDCFYEAISIKGWDRKVFYEELTRVFHIIKSRQYKRTHQRNKSKQF